MVVDLRIDRPKFVVFGEIALTATARAAEPLLLIPRFSGSHGHPISPIHVTSKSLRAEVVRIIRRHRCRDQAIHRCSCFPRDRQPCIAEGEDHRRGPAALMGPGPASDVPRLAAPDRP